MHYFGITGIIIEIFICLPFIIMKKLWIFTLIWLSTLLVGCTIPGIPDPQQVVDQTRMLTEMQQQMTDLLSGMNALQQQNLQMSGMLAKLESYIESQKTATEDTETHGAASLSDLRLFGWSGSFEDFGSWLGLPIADMSWGVVAESTNTGDALWIESITDSWSSSSKNLLLEELKKASLKKSISSGNHITWSTATHLGK